MSKHPIDSYLEYKGAQVPARGSGWRKMRCPFHEDRNASAAVNFDANRFKCHGCGVSGDTYDLIMHDKGGTLSEAIEFAETISPAGDSTVRFKHRPSTGLSRSSGSIGRRGSHVSLGGGRRSATGT